MQKVLINSDKYDGQYVAIKSVDDSTVVGSGTNPIDALNEAKKNGIHNPFLVYVPVKGLVQIYYVG